MASRNLQFSDRQHWLLILIDCRKPPFEHRRDASENPGGPGLAPAKRNAHSTYNRISKDLNSFLLLMLNQFNTVAPLVNLLNAD